MATMGKKLVFITGANTGIGYETVRALVQSPRPYHIFLGSRSVERGREAAEAVRAEFPDSPSSAEVIQVDISSDQSINDAFEKVKNGPGYIDALVNNAGLALAQKVDSGEMTIRESWNQTYDVNVAGTEVMTTVFAPLLLKSSDPRLVFVTSGLSSLQHTGASLYPPMRIPAGWPKAIPYNTSSYRSSKAALNMMMLWWHWALKEDGAKVWSISPGFLATGLGGIGNEVLKARGAGHPSLGGIFIKDVLEGKRDADVGKVISSGGIQPF